MLNGIPGCLGPQLLFNLRAMGHGDEIALVDANYPAQSDANGAGGLVRADGVSILELLDAVLALMPLDEAVEHPAMIATVKGDGKTFDPIHIAMSRVVERRCGGAPVASPILAMEGAAFYERVKSAHTIVATSEPSLYANIILRKGAIKPPMPVTPE
jgi:L-fucose mutarotase